MIQPAFGDSVENPHASVENPHRFGLFVRRVFNAGRLNHGRYYELTDGKGEFWRIPMEIAIIQRAPLKTITIHLEGGLVQDVTGIPARYEVRVEDRDEGDTSHPSWDEKKGCFVTVYGGDGV